MNKLLIVTIALVAAVGIGAVAINSNSTSSRQTSNRNFSTIQSDLKTGAKLYDVRTSQEYTAGHFTNADNWSLQDMQNGTFPNINKDTTLFVYCQSGNRSSQATAALKAAGFTNVTDLGGLQDVRAIGGTLQDENKEG